MLTRITQTQDALQSRLQAVDAVDAGQSFHDLHHRQLIENADRISDPQKQKSRYIFDSFGEFYPKLQRRIALTRIRPAK